MDEDKGKILAAIIAAAAQAQDEAALKRALEDELASFGNWLTNPDGPDDDDDCDDY